MGQGRGLRRQIAADGARVHPAAGRPDLVASAVHTDPGAPERDLQTVRGSAREREERLLSDQERLAELQSLSERLRVEHDSEMRRVKLESGAESSKYRKPPSGPCGELQKMRTVCVALERQPRPEPSSRSCGGLPRSGEEPRSATRPSSSCCSASGSNARRRSAPRLPPRALSFSTPRRCASASGARGDQPAGVSHRRAVREGGCHRAPAERGGAAL